MHNPSPFSIFAAQYKKQHQPDETIKVEVRLEDETVWLTQAQIVELFQSSKANVSEHIKLEISPIII